eukprot:gb/GECG01011805.1/.p1 GENE.gb/GECG01011805.1/~~gb/GECG01011805.1/.p1  ORF type:complete len:154 (+),score=13.34 gb/GECG01011805.1/:1-462(+)
MRYSARSFEYLYMGRLGRFFRSVRSLSGFLQYHSLTLPARFRFPGHPQSVDAILRVDEDTIITGSSDGIIRVIQILPNQMLGIIGEHTDLPIERLQYDRTKSFIGSTSHDNFIKFWDVSMFQEGATAEGESAAPSTRSEGLQKDPVKEFFADL